MHSDLMFSDFQDLMRNDIADIMYSDPPWGEGNLKYWQTINNRQTGADKNPVNYSKFLWRIFDIAKTHVKPEGMVFIEYGIAWHNNVKMTAAKHGFHNLGTIRLNYRSGVKFLPLDLHLFSQTPVLIKDNYIDSVRDTHGFETLKQAITPFVSPGMKILDPCCGMGYTAQFAVDNGLTFFGNELNRSRLNKTIKRLSK